MVKRCKILPPQSRMGALDDGERVSQINSCYLYNKYMEMVDRDSAYEFLERQRQSFEGAMQQRELAEQQEKLEAAQKRQVKSAVGRVAGTAAGTIGRELGNEVGKMIGGSFGKKLGGNVGASLGRGILSTLFKLK